MGSMKKTRTDLKRREKKLTDRHILFVKFCQKNFLNKKKQKKICKISKKNQFFHIKLPITLKLLTLQANHYDFRKIQGKIH